ncbi:MAG: 2-oxo acid dehydrogenase subunit E2 [Actinophytocola sp.]|uniref:2-oxo acid dehydrogenase subunit E2 n=1 Tax=Actinophytocola sp. TaxID=1872138 RepID=UPI003C737CEC
MTELVVPKLNNNDDSYTLVEWLAEDGAEVRAGDAVAVIETSKAATDLEVERDGVLHRAVPALAECTYGDVIARVFASDQQRQDFLATQRTEVVDQQREQVVVTNSAREAAQRLGVPLERLRELGKKVVKQADVEGLVTPEDAVTLTRAQRAVAAVVTESHRDVPAALAVMKVHVDSALRRARQFGRQTGSLIGLPELLVAAVAGLRARFPSFFAARVDDRSIRLADAAHVGVTVDVGTGLFVPVIRSADDLATDRVANTLMEFRERALAGGFESKDLAGANIMVSLHTDQDVVLAAPIVYPGQTCVVCLAGVTHELALDETGEVTSHRVVNISIVYDHRVVNGREAVAFLQAIKEELENGPAIPTEQRAQPS